MGLLFSLTSIALPAIVLLLALDFMGLLKWKNHFPVDGKTVLITGASSGMGKSAARILSSKGASVILVARDQTKLDEAAKEAAAAALRPGSQRFHTISADVSSASENTRLLREATEWNNGTPPDIVWAIAGVAYPMLFLETTMEQMHRQMDVNFWSCAYLAQEVLKAWVSPNSAPKLAAGSNAEPDTRHLIFTSSVAAVCPVAGYAPYAPSKAAIRNLSDCLRSEINLYNAARRRKTSGPGDIAPPPTDIQIHTCLPGTISSPATEVENATKHDITHLLEETDPVQSPDQVASLSIEGLERGDYLVVTNWVGKATRASSWQGSPRNNWLLEFFWTTGAFIVWFFVSHDMERTVWNYGKKWGLKGKPKDA